MVVSNSYTKITFLPEQPLQTYVDEWTEIEVTTGRFETKIDPMSLFVAFLSRCPAPHGKPFFSFSNFD